MWPGRGRRELIQLIWDRKIDPGKVFDLTLPSVLVDRTIRRADEHI